MAVKWGECSGKQQWAGVGAVEGGCADHTTGLGSSLGLKEVVGWVGGCSHCVLSEHLPAAALARPALWL